MALEPCPHCHRGFDHDNAGARQNHVDACPYNPENMPQANKEASGESPREPVEVAQHPAREEDGPAPNIPLMNQSAAEEPATEPRVVDPDDRELPQRHVQDVEESNLPAVQSTQAIEQGIALGRPLYDLARGGPAEKEEAQADLISMFGSALVSYGQQSKQAAQDGRDRAKRTSADQISVVEQYPPCPLCDAQLTNLPEPGVEFSCPSCGVVLTS